MKRLISVFLVCVILACLLSACQSDKVVGKWYNANGNCLTVNSDGTYKIDNDYGTGTWKRLDDKETIQFIDFYGSATETTIKTDDDGSYIEIEMFGKFYNKQNKSKSNSESSISIYRAGNFSHGVAWIGYIENDVDCAALINTDGKILYKKEKAYPQDFQSVKTEYRFYAPFPGIDYVKYRDENDNTFYEIVNEKGKVISTSKSGEYDRVIACGDEMALVYKDTGGVSAESHSFGIIDKNGKWKLKLTELPNKETESDYYDRYKPKRFNGYYAGCGVFYISANGKYLLNAETGQYAETDISDIKFYNDRAYCYYYQEYYSADYYTLIDKDLKQTQLPIKEKSFFAGDFLFCKTDMSITNMKTGKVVYTGYETEQFAGFVYQNGIGLLKISGKDGNPYFTAFNEDLKCLFEPIQGEITLDYDSSIYSFSEKYILFNRTENNRLKSFIVKTDGTMVGEYKNDNKYIAKCGSFEDGIAPARHNEYDEQFFINAKGERVLQTLYER